MKDYSPESTFFSLILIAPYTVILFISITFFFAIFTKCAFSLLKFLC